MLFGQRKTTTQSKQNYSEIDALAKKYLGVEKVVLTTPNSSLTAKVSISYNESGKPYAVTFSGKESGFDLSENRSLPKIEDLFRTLKEQKTAKGYLYNETLSKFRCEACNSNEVYKKGNMYTRFVEGWVMKNSLEPYETGVSQTFEISTVDFLRSRKAGSTKFDF